MVRVMTALWKLDTSFEIPIGVGWGLAEEGGSAGTLKEKGRVDICPWESSRRLARRLVRVQLPVGL